MLEDLFWFGIRWSQGPQLNEIKITEKNSDNLKYVINEKSGGMNGKGVNVALNNNYSESKEISRKMADDNFQVDNISKEITHVNLISKNVTVEISPAQNNTKHNLFYISKKKKEEEMIEMEIKNEIDSEIGNETESEIGRNNLKCNTNCENEKENSHLNVINKGHMAFDKKVGNNSTSNTDHTDIIRNSNSKDIWAGKMFHSIDLVLYKNIFRQSERIPLYIEAWKILTSLKLGDLMLLFLNGLSASSYYNNN